jgi:hypothetical protein
MPVLKSLALATVTTLADAASRARHRSHRSPHLQCPSGTGSRRWWLHELASLRSSLIRTDPLVGEAPGADWSLSVGKNAPGILLLSIFCLAVIFGVTACSSARINGMQLPAPMSGDVERQHLQALS